MNQKNIRNFVIIAHIDHGKSTLADRFLEITGTVPREKLRPQMLDMMELERERGITIKLQPVRMVYRPSNSKQITNFDHQISNSNSDFGFRASDLSNSAYTLNLIDTPGHVDFSYEVSRALKAVEGAILLVDATKGIQAQTLANLHLARTNNLAIIPVINKIDLPNAEVEKATQEISELLNVSPEQILKISAKTGEGVEKLLEAIIKLIPPPKGERDRPLKALIFDSCYDSYRGVIAYIRVFDGKISRGDKIRFFATNKSEQVLEVGEFGKDFIERGFRREAGPPATQAMTLRAGEIGYLVTGTKEIGDVQVGETIFSVSPILVSPIPGFKKPQPMVFASFYLPGKDATLLRKALEKYKLNDSSLSFEPENSQTFGQGYKVGFLGLLHMEITKIRLEREYNLELLIGHPEVNFRIAQIGEKTIFEEPWVNLEIVTPKEYLGPIMELASSRRAIYLKTSYLSDRIILKYEAPLMEIITDFYDQLKSISSGYASQNYELIEWRKGDLTKLEVLIAKEKISEFSRIVPLSRAQNEAKNLAKKLKNLIPRQMFEVSIQVAHSTSSGQTGKILAREDISAMKKDVTQKLYGGDRTRKDKLLKKQAAGKKKMQMIGKVNLPSDVFIEMLK